MLYVMLCSNHTPTSGVESAHAPNATARCAGIGLLRV